MVPVVSFALCTMKNNNNNNKTPPNERTKNSNKTKQTNKQISQRRHTIDRLEERGVERGSARRSSLKRTREGHRQSDEHWNRFKRNVEETSGRRGGAHTYGLFRAHRYYIELN